MNPNIKTIVPLQNDINIVHLNNGDNLKIQNIYNSDDYNHREIDNQNIDWIVFKS